MLPSHFSIISRSSRFIKPTEISFGSHLKVWWVCNKGHHYQSCISHRTSIKKTGCPYCAGRRVLIGFNDLRSINLALASEWNDERNGNSTPDDFTANSNQKVWWKCSEGHEWQATIASRNSGRGCPRCAGKKRWETRRKATETKKRPSVQKYTP